MNQKNDPQITMERKICDVGDVVVYTVTNITGESRIKMELTTHNSDVIHGFGSDESEASYHLLCNIKFRLMERCNVSV